MKHTEDVPFTGDPEAWDDLHPRSVRLSHRDWWMLADIASPIERDRSWVLRKLIRYAHTLLFDEDGNPRGGPEKADETLDALGLR